MTDGVSERFDKGVRSDPDASDIVLYTAKQVADLCQVTEYTVREWLREEKLKGIRMNNKWRVSRQALREFLAEKYAHLATEVTPGD